jgi:hypothetical protein
MLELPNDKMHLLSSGLPVLWKWTFAEQGKVWENHECLLRLHSIAPEVTPYLTLSLEFYIHSGFR